MDMGPTLDFGGSTGKIANPGENDSRTWITKGKAGTKETDKSKTRSSAAVP